MSTGETHTMSLHVDDLIQGLNDWRNIQDIVRLTFRAMNDVVKAQGRTIAALESKVVQYCILVVELLLCDIYVGR